MATKEEIRELLLKFRECRPQVFPGSLDVNNIGMMGVLLYLYEHGRKATPGEISSANAVSTARMAVMLKNLEEKEMITRAPHPDDTRKAVITLSPKGYEYIRAKQQNVTDFMTRLVDHIGYERMLDYIELTWEIKSFCAEEMKKVLPDDSFPNGLLKNGNKSFARSEL